MNAITRHLSIVIRRVFLIFVGATVLIVSIVELSPMVFRANPNVAKAANGDSPEATLSKESLPSYRWNLHDDGLPLISLPDHIGGNVDLAITYSLDQFQFPLFQTLYFNRSSGKYILMVMTKESARAEFIVLDPVNAGDHFQSGGNAKVNLLDQGDVKLLTASDGTTYTFAQFDDGELHCNRINDRDGAVINLEYTSDSSIESIADDAGRKISFNYTDRYLSSVTQTWNVAHSKLKQTWAIAERDTFANRPLARILLTRVEFTKRIPTNATTPGYTRDMAASDVALAAIFGGRRAIAAANGFEPRQLSARYPLYRGDLVGDDGRILRGHLSFAMHVYGSDDGTGDTDLYVPAGFVSHSTMPTPTDAAVTFYYPRLGNFTDVTLAVFHVDNFQISLEGTRVRIGTIGGRGGSIATYKHSHLEFYRGDTGLPSTAARVRLRIDPATVFAASTNIASRIG